MKTKTSLLLILGMILFALLVAALIPDIEAQDDTITWQPQAMQTTTVTPTPTTGWFDDLPTPSHGTSTPTPDLSITPNTVTPVISRTPTLGPTDILITLTAEAENDK